jgi:subtilisin-like proprotein convertase family protein
VVLHQRSGGSADDVRQAWRSDAHAGLAALAGTPALGDWTLTVADLAPRDVGTLASWSIEATLGAERTVVEVAASPGATIPDNEASGVSSEVVVDAAGVASSVEVDLDITHTYVGDLEVTLTGPDGTRATLHGRSGGSSDNLVTTFSSQDGGRLEPFVGRPVDGTWRLDVADRAGLDVGKLNRWALRAYL